MAGRRWKLLVALGCVAAMLGAFVGTAGATRARSAAAGSASCDSPGVTDDTVKIGVIYEGTGPQAATFADVLHGLNARLAKLEDDGGLPGGRTIEFVEADDAADDAQNLTAAKRVVEEEDVFMVFEITSHSKGSAAYLHSKGIPVVGWAIDAVWGQYDNMFGYRNSFSPNPKGVPTSTTPNVLKSLGVTRVAILGVDNSAGTISTNNMAKAARKIGLKVAYKATVPADSTDFTSIAQKLEEKNVDGIATLMDIIPNNALMQAVEQAGFRDQIKGVVLPFGYDPRVPPAFPALVDTLVGVDFHPYEENLPGHQDFFTYYEQVNGADAVKSQISMVSWLAGGTMIKGFEVAGECPTQANYIKKLRKVKDFDNDGLAQTVNFKQVFGQPILCLYYVNDTGTGWETQFNGEVQCGKALK